jgi:hypothetical protein
MITLIHIISTKTARLYTNHFLEKLGVLAAHKAAARNSLHPAKPGLRLSEGF